MTIFSEAATSADLDALRHHGDRETGPGLVDLAVNVRAHTPPAWLTRRLADVDLAAYPDGIRARAVVAARHRRNADEVLLTAGAAEAFVLIARAFTPRLAVVVHPQFTEPEVALRAAGHPVQRVVLAWPFTFDPALVPVDADLVVIGNPTNPTAVLHSAASIAALARPGRLVVVDEAFADCTVGEPESLAAPHSPAAPHSLAATWDLPGLVVVRSLTKTWGLAGLRAGYVLAAADLVARLAEAQPPWAVSSPALVACEACSAPDAIAESEAWARGLVQDRDHLLGLLAGIAGVQVVPGAAASFVLFRVPSSDAREALRRKGFAVRRGETFPGLDATWLRVAVRDRRTSGAFADALRQVLDR